MYSYATNNLFILSPAVMSAVMVMGRTVKTALALLMVILYALGE